MTPPWYVWLVAEYNLHTNEQFPDGFPGLEIVGIFDSYERAKAAATPGCFISVFALNDAATGYYEVTQEWVE